MRRKSHARFLWGEIPARERPIQLLYRLRALIDDGFWHLDVDSSYPRAVQGPKGLAVRQLKGYVS